MKGEPPASLSSPPPPPGSRRPLCICGCYCSWGTRAPSPCVPLSSGSVRSALSALRLPQVAGPAVPLERQGAGQSRWCTLATPCGGVGPSFLGWRVEGSLSPPAGLCYGPGTRICGEMVALHVCFRHLLLRACLDRLLKLASHKIGEIVPQTVRVKIK